MQLTSHKRFMEERLAHEVTYATRHGSELCVLMFDLDHFKQINDTYGHVAGDELLKSIAERMKSLARREDLVARLGGDEFMVVLRNAEREAAAARFLSAPAHGLGGEAQAEIADAVASA